MEKECLHKHENGESAIIVPFNIFFGTLPPLHKGICSICKKYVELKEEEFEKLKREFENKRG